MPKLTNSANNYGRTDGPTLIIGKLVKFQIYNICLYPESKCTSYNINFSPCFRDEITNQLKKQRGKLENSVSAADAVVTP